MAVKVTAHKTITLCSVYLPPRNHFNFNPKDLQNVIDQLPSPFILMEELQAALRRAHDTSAGPDEIHYQLLKHLLSSSLLLLLNIFNINLVIR